jgi:hypothetical protein
MYFLHNLTFSSQPVPATFSRTQPHVVRAVTHITFADGPHRKAGKVSPVSASKHPRPLWLAPAAPCERSPLGTHTVSGGSAT